MHGQTNLPLSHCCTPYANHMQLGPQVYWALGSPWHREAPQVTADDDPWVNGPPRPTQAAKALQRLCGVFLNAGMRY